MTTRTKSIAAAGAFLALFSVMLAYTPDGQDEHIIAPAPSTTHAPVAALPATPVVESAQTEAPESTPAPMYLLDTRNSSPAGTVSVKIVPPEWPDVACLDSLIGTIGCAHDSVLGERVCGTCRRSVLLPGKTYHSDATGSYMIEDLPGIYEPVASESVASRVSKSIAAPAPTAAAESALSAYSTNDGKYKKLIWYFSNIPNHPTDLRVDGDMKGTPRCVPWCDVQPGDIATFTMTRGGLPYRVASIMLTGPPTPPNDLRIVAFALEKDVVNVSIDAYMTRASWHGTGAMPEWAKRIKPDKVTFVGGTTDAVGSWVYDARLDGEL